MPYKSTIGKLYGADVIVETILEKRDGYSKDFGTWALDTSKLGKIIEHAIPPYAKFPKILPFSFDNNDGKPTPGGIEEIPAEIERVEIKIIYKES